ncbi:hypothetical protein QC764_0040390 [Podospora pseudoanserina]|uniref:Uncharacterized protein n=1 Tax=Podospora pseudoanserina TaxID=2609844 RepID=A0ABR0IHW2_9PEZI|nr:hypothetical protein QC764_0040390 [Podospora pseudoanserina]
MVAYANPECVSVDDNCPIDLRTEPGIDEGRRPVFIFPTLPVVDLRCFSFDKEGDTGFWSPRFPVATKVHWDRTFHDTISFQQLQELAEEARNMTTPEGTQEIFTWIANLQGIESSSQSTATNSQRSLVSSRNTMSPGPRGDVSPRVDRRVPIGAATLSAPLSFAADEGIDRDRDRDVLSQDAHDENTLQIGHDQLRPHAGYSNFPYVGDLLRSHGIHEPVIDANSWKEKRFASTKRLALVEAQRREATQAFFDVITSLELRKRGLDEHEYIPIFDWRVLERLKTEQAKKGMEARGEG